VSSHYTPEEKANALIHLHMHGDNIAYTSHELGIPQRTLREWRGKWYAENPPPQSPPRQTQRSDFADDLEALAYVRKQLMYEIVDMADTFREGMKYTSPSQRFYLMSQLLDRLMKLDQHLKPYRLQKEEFIRITWEMGLYLRTEGGYRGPYFPQFLPLNWRDKYGPARLEIYWGDGTFTPLSDELAQTILEVRNFADEHCEIGEIDDDDFDHAYTYDHASKTRTSAS
jgi:transposase-like protein